MPNADRKFSRRWSVSVVALTFLAVAAAACSKPGNNSIDTGATTDTIGLRNRRAPADAAIAHRQSGQRAVVIAHEQDAGANCDATDTKRISHRLQTFHPYRAANNYSAGDALSI